MDTQNPPIVKKVAVFTSLDKVYQDINDSIKLKHEPRFIHLKDRFKDLYACDAQFYGRAPGRVNIIGEHIDYCGYSVLPAAIEQDFLMAFRVIPEGEEGCDEIQIMNMDSVNFPHTTLSTDPFQKLKETGDWKNYFLCGYKAILAHNEDLRKLMEDKNPAGMKILIDSIVPPAAGLSSSSAFVVCAAVTTMYANGLTDHITQ